MEDRGENMQQMTTGRIRTRVAAFRTVTVRALTRCATGPPHTGAIHIMDVNT